VNKTSTFRYKKYFSPTDDLGIGKFMWGGGGRREVVKMEKTAF
jgi:hypothetical protein